MFKFNIEPHLHTVLFANDLFLLVLFVDWLSFSSNILSKPNRLSKFSNPITFMVNVFSSPNSRNKRLTNSFGFSSGTVCWRCGVWRFARKKFVSNSSRFGCSVVTDSIVFVRPRRLFGNTNGTELYKAESWPGN